MNFLERFEGYTDLGLHGVRLPHFKIEDKYYRKLNVDPGVDNYTFLVELCKHGAKNRGLSKLNNYKDYKARIKTELDLFKELGYVDYLLLVWDVINFAHDNGIATGIGRGSCGGSLTLYLMGVTGIDPIKHGLYFERFVSKARSKSTVVDGVTYFDGSLLPDIDTDFDYLRRQEVLEYVQNKFKGRTCKILTVGTLQGKAVIKETTKICGGYTDQEANLVSNRIDKVFGSVQHISEAINEGLKNWVKQEKREFQFMSNAEIAKVACKIEGLPKNFGVHASAMGVSYQPLNELCPVQLTKDGELVSSYTKNDIENLCVKLDVLGLKTMTVLSNLSKQTGIDLDSVDIDDPEMYKAINGWQNNMYGIFQLEGHTALKALMQVKPDSIEDISAINALARPGGMAHIPAFARRKNGEEEVPELHPELDKITKDTYGFIIYQEQIMRAFHLVFGFTLEEAEIIRRIIGKKKVEQIKEWQPKIYEAGKRKGLSEEIIDKFWKDVEASSNYSFNKSHSMAYSILAMQCAYFKWKYPTEFFCEYLKIAKFASNADGGPQGEIAKITQELNVFGITLERPDLMKSQMDFNIESSKSIRYGLVSIRGIAEKKKEALLSFRGEYSNKFEMFQAAKNSGLDIGSMSALIQAGAMASTNEKRCWNVLEAQVWNLLTDREKKYFLHYGEDHNYKLFDMLKWFVETDKKDEKGKKSILTNKRYDTIKNNSNKYVEIWKNNKQQEDLANWFFERKLLGFSYSGKLNEILSGHISNLMDMSNFTYEVDGQQCNYVGIVTDVMNRKSKNGKNMLRLTLEDTNALVTAIFYDKSYDKWALKNKDEKDKVKLPKTDSIVLITGQKSKGDAIFINSLRVLDEKIYLKLSDLK